MRWCTHRNTRRILGSKQFQRDRNRPTPRESLFDYSACLRFSRIILWSLQYRRPSAESVFLACSSHLHSRSEEHTSELQSHLNLVCRLLLEKKKKEKKYQRMYTYNNT